MDILSPPEDIRNDYYTLMQRTFSKEVKPLILFYPNAIRKLLKKLEVQYTCLGNQDLITEPPFDEFIKKDINKIVIKLFYLIEGNTDQILGY